MNVDAHAPGESLWCLVVGSDGRQGLARRLRHLRADISGRRADAMALGVIAADGSRAAVIRIPRDILVDTAGVGLQRLGWALDYFGPDGLIEAVRTECHVPVHHYVEFGFTAFARATRLLRGPAERVEPARSDARTGLVSSANSPRSDRSLALARSRTPSGGSPETDLERIEIQNNFIRKVLEDAGPTRLVLSAAIASTRARRDLHLDGAWNPSQIRAVVGAVTNDVTVETLEVQPFDSEHHPTSPFLGDLITSPSSLRIADRGRRRLEELAST